MASLSENNIHIVQTLSKDDLDFIHDVEEKCRQDNKVLDQLYQGICRHIGDEDAALGHSGMSVDTKLQACIEHIVIGLTSGSMTKDDIKDATK